MTNGDALLELVYRRDGTYDFRRAAGVSNAAVMGILRGIADQIEAGATIEDPATP